MRITPVNRFNLQANTFSPYVYFKKLTKEFRTEHNVFFFNLLNCSFFILYSLCKIPKYHISSIKSIEFVNEFFLTRVDSFPPNSVFKKCDNIEN